MYNVLYIALFTAADKHSIMKYIRTVYVGIMLILNSGTHTYLHICSHGITYHYIKPMYLVTYAVICSHLQKYSNSVKMTTSTGIVEGSPFVL